MLLAFVPYLLAPGSRRQHEVGHEGVITGCDGFSLRSSIADPQVVVQSPLQSTYLHSRRLIKVIHIFLGGEPFFYCNNITCAAAYCLECVILTNPFTSSPLKYKTGLPASPLKTSTS